MKIDSKVLILCIVICFLPGILGSLYTFNEITTWYAQLHKSFLNPPNWVFGPVWTILYGFQSISLYLLVKGKAGNRVFALFGFNLLLNTLWTIIFFGGHMVLAAFIEILLLIIVVALLIKWALQIDKKAGYLLVPYLLWISFASLLNLGVLLLN